MYNKTSVDLLTAYIYSDTYAKTDTIFEIQKIRAMGANFPIVSDAVFSMMEPWKAILNS